MNIQIKRVYEKPDKDDGMRILVDRLWPRGFTKEKAKIDIWLKEIAPSNELRQWFHLDPTKRDEFKNRYFEELEANKKVVEQLKDYLKNGNVTFVYSAKNEEFNNASVLKDYCNSTGRL